MVGINYSWDLAFVRVREQLRIKFHPAKTDG